MFTVRRVLTTVFFLVAIASAFALYEYTLFPHRESLRVVWDAAYTWAEALTACLVGLAAGVIVRVALSEALTKQVSPLAIYYNPTTYEQIGSPTGENEHRVWWFDERRDGVPRVLCHKESTCFEFWEFTPYVIRVTIEIRPDPEQHAAFRKLCASPDFPWDREMYRFWNALRERLYPTINAFLRTHGVRVSNRDTVPLDFIDELKKALAASLPPVLHEIIANVEIQIR